MKMKREVFEELQRAIARYFEGIGEDITAWQARYCARGLSDERFRWDCLHASKYPARKLYDLNDFHIDTALKRVVHNLTSA